MPKVSIIVPVYNVENYIKKCLTSLVKQTLQEIEIIVVNDGSTDNSKNIIEDFLKQYPEKIIYLEKQNGGLSDARNYGIPYAKGEYIAFLDSDDYVELNTYEEMYELAKKENSDMVQCNFYWEYPNKQKIGDMSICKNKKEMIQNGRVEAWNKLIKTDILKQSGVIFPKGYQYEDVEFTYKLILNLNKVAFLNRPLIHYVQRENSIANSQNERTKEILDVLEHVLKYYQDKGCYEKYKDSLEYIYVKTLLCRSLFRMAKIKDKKTRKDLLDLTWKTIHEKFPNWKQNAILKKGKGMKHLYIKSINKITYQIYTALLKGVK